MCTWYDIFLSNATTSSSESDRHGEISSSHVMTRPHGMAPVVVELIVDIGHRVKLELMHSYAHRDDNFTHP